MYCYTFVTLEYTCKINIYDFKFTYGRDYFVPLTDALASTDSTNTFATHLPPIRGAKKPAKKPTAETCRSRFEQL